MCGRMFQGFSSISSGGIGKLAVLYGELNAVRVGEAAAGWRRLIKHLWKRTGRRRREIIQSVRRGDDHKNIRSEWRAEGAHTAAAHPDLGTSRTRVIEYTEVRFCKTLFYSLIFF